MSEMFDPPAAEGQPSETAAPTGQPAIPMPPAAPSAATTPPTPMPAVSPALPPPPAPAPTTQTPTEPQPASAPTEPQPASAPTEPQPASAPTVPGQPIAPPPPVGPPTQPYPGAPAPYPWSMPAHPWVPATAQGAWVPPGGTVPPTGYVAGGAAWGPSTPPAGSPSQPRHHRTGWAIAVAALAVLVGTGAGLGIGYAAWQGASQPSNSNAGSAIIPPGFGNGSGGSNSQNPFGSNGFGNFGSGNSGSGSSGSGSSGSGSSGSGNSSATSGVAGKVDGALVDINTTLSYQGEQAAGTGIVLTSNGEVLTNNHVIDGETSLSVTDLGNGKTYKASVVGYDRTQDVAVIQLQGASGLQTASLGNSSNVSVGQSVVGIGNAGGTGGTPSAAAGTITALNQSITASDDGGGNSEQLSGLIQTNADIQPGDSGGPLVDSAGQVVGMDTAASSNFQFQAASNTGFAIPINRAVSLAHQIVAGNGSSTVHIGATAFLGIEVEDAGSSNSGLGGLGNSGSSNAPSSGATVVKVVPGGSAASAGLAAGDTITAVDGHTVTSASDLTNIMTNHHPGDTITFTYTDSSGNQQTGSATLASGPPQ